MDYQYDLFVIGAGPGGYVPAIRAAAYGLKTAVAEKDFVGGTCLNRGCIPTKTLLHSAELYGEIKRAGEFGITTGETAISREALKNRKIQVTEDLRKGIEGAFKKAKITQIKGKAKITGKHEVTVEGEDGAAVYTADKILISAGSEPARLPIPGADLPGVLNSDGLLDRGEQPFESLIIIGGGVIGMEFASLYQALGTKVTVLEALDKLLATMDKEFGQSVKMLMKKRGVDIHTGAMVQKIEKTEKGFSCIYKEKEKEQVVFAEGILIAVGRKPCTNGLFGENIEIQTERGRIAVNEHLQTSIPNIYAVGDVIGGIQLAHVASAEGLHAVAHMAGREEEVRLDLVPSCVYTNPEIASVGLTVDEAKKQEIPVKSVKYPMSANGKSLLSSQERGFVKIVFHEETRKVLGAQMMCARATDMISIFGTAVANGLTVEDMKKNMYPHPTFSEGIGEALELAVFY